MSRLERLTARVTELFDGFRFSHAALDLYGAFWSELCDWYLELAKPRLYDEDNDAVSAVLLLGARAHPAAAAPGDAVRDRGDLVPACPASAACWPCADWPVADEARRRGGRGRARAPDRGRHVAAPLPRRGRRQARGARSAGGWPPTATRGCRPPSPGWRASSWSRTAPTTATCWRRCRCPAAGCRCCPPTPSTPPRRERRRAAGASSSTREIERAERKLANEKFVERRPPRWWTRSARKLEEYREALRRLETE